MHKLLKSPLNYTGNKFRTFQQMECHFPKNMNVMVDMFCGGATVGINVSAKKVIFIDSDKKIINLLIFLSKQNFNVLMKQLESLIKKYKLSYSFKNGYQIYRKKCHDLSDATGLKDYNKLGYGKLRHDYNLLKSKSSKKANLMLYLLMVYGYNNDIRFNSGGFFNIPVGKTDLNKMNIEKLKQFINKAKRSDFEFKCLSFDDPKIKNIIKKADFVYMDPPYLITKAVYNMFWSATEEHKLLDLIDWMVKNKINFGLSNVLSKKGKTNEPLSYWCHKNISYIDIHNINYNYKSSSHNKKIRDAKEREVLITNKDY